ncbi:hypothetical protein D4765_17965 [Subtercola vilae]|uniref:Phospholipase n=1 Tax=Subtercola vilae TaxID=2056433 RepID=A0A4T2BDL1_9MICO|nr:hypothetical protein D4765_17965 [Subtercola vilae]
MSSAAASRATRRAAFAARRHSYRSKLVIATAVVAVGLVAGTGFVVQSAVADSQATAAAHAVALARTQASLDSTTEKSLAVANAQTAIAAADLVVAEAQAKTDTSGLTSTISTLSNYTLLDPKTVTGLTAQTAEKTTVVVAAAAEADRVAAVAAAQAAADAAAAAAAAEALAEANTPSGAKATAENLASSEYGWGSDQFSCLVSLWQKESGWSYTASNGSSGAAGIPQALPGSKMASIASDWQTNAATQVAWGLKYIASSYGSPCSAWSHSQSVNWY